MPSSGADQLKKFLSSMPIEERECFAKACGTTLGNLQQIIYVNKKCSAELAIQIDKASNNNVSCDLLCPGADFNYLRGQALSA